MIVSPCDRCSNKACTSIKNCDRYLKWFNAVWEDIRAAAKKMEAENVQQSDTDRPADG